MENGNNAEITHSDQLERKMHKAGKIVKTSKAGVIVDIGVEKPALLHISQIISNSDAPIKRVEDILKEGQTLDVWVRNVRNGRIEVTMKEPLKYEWRDLNKEMVVRGKVVEIEKFGAFVDIGAERPGLMHISELSRTYVKNTTDVVNVGDDVEVMIIDFNRRKKQIKLSMKILQPEIVEIKEEKVQEKQEKEEEPHFNRKDNRGKQKVEENYEPKEEVLPVEPEQTAMELAWLAAKDKVSRRKEPKNKNKNKNQRFLDDEQEDILSRTLNDRRK